MSFVVQDRVVASKLVDGRAKRDHDGGEWNSKWRAFHLTAG
jgi:hypothetical protein